MPNCFQLHRKTDGVAESLNVVDEQLCKLINCPVDPKKYCFGWFDSIGYSIACGGSFAELRTYYTAKAVEFPEDKEFFDTLNKFVDYLDEHYTTDAFVEIGRR